MLFHSDKLALSFLFSVHGTVDGNRDEGSELEVSKRSSGECECV